VQCPLDDRRDIFEPIVVGARQWRASGEVISSQKNRSRISSTSNLFNREKFARAVHEKNRDRRDAA
jgi:hypothetical protein